MHVKGSSTWCEVFMVMKNTFQYHCHCGFHTEAHKEITVNLSSYVYIRPYFPSRSLTPQLKLDLDRLLNYLLVWFVHLQCGTKGPCAIQSPP